MPQSYNLKLGFDDQRIAEAILSKFSFIAKPSLNPDDIGIDFFCTIFENINDQCYPRNTFAIQIKGNKDTIDITDKIGLLAGFELPYYVGVIDRNNCILSIYSGEYLNHFFTLKGTNLNSYKVKISLLDRPITKDFTNSEKYFYREHIKLKTFYLNFYKIIELKITRILHHELHCLINNISIIQRNISQRFCGEFLYEVDLNLIKKLGLINDIENRKYMKLYAGIGSSKVFMQNLYYRYAEVFVNLNWILKSISGSTNRKKEHFENELKSIYNSISKNLDKLIQIDSDTQNKYSKDLALEFREKFKKLQGF